jgi:hypothetical protein
MLMLHSQDNVFFSIFFYCGDLFMEANIFQFQTLRGLIWLLIFDSSSVKCVIKLWIDQTSLGDYLVYVLKHSRQKLN